MKLQRREKILAIATLGIVAVAGLYILSSAGDSRSSDELLQQQSKLTTEIAERQRLLQLADRDRRRLVLWQRRSLPADVETARSLYQNWLRGLAAGINFRDFRLDSNDVGTHRDQFARISFTLHARAELGDLVKFLYEFYAAGYLHKIGKMDVKRNGGSRDLDVNLTIEALSLPTAVSKNKLPGKLPKDAWAGPQLARLVDYRNPIVARDFFSPYVRSAPSAPSRPREGTVDLADYTVVTGLIEVNGVARVWLFDRTVPPEGRLWELGVGDGFTVGNVHGKVLTIRPQEDAVFEFDGHRRLLRLGESLRGGIEIPDQRPNQAEKSLNAPGLTSVRGN